MRQRVEDQPVTRLEIGRNAMVELTEDELTIRIDLNYREGWERCQARESGNIYHRRIVATSNGFRWIQIPDPEGIFRDSRILLSIFAFERATPDMEPGLCEITEPDEPTEEELADKRLLDRWREKRSKATLRRAIDRMRQGGE